MDVTDVIRDRSSDPDGLQRMITISLLAHAAFAALLVLAPGDLLGRRAVTPANVMRISIAGAGEGPRNGGLTPAAAQPVQAQTPPEEAAKREPVRPPAAKTPEMVVPATKAPPRVSRTPPPVVREAPADATGRTPTRGSQTTRGESLTYTGARGQGFGLSTGGGAGTGSTLDVADFCCPDYIVAMLDRIRSGWQQNQGARGDVFVKFTVQRNGQITDAAIETTSGSAVLDLAALRAVVGTRTLNPLPAAFPNPTLGVRLSFQYR